MKIKINRGPETIFLLKILVVVGFSFLIYLVANYLYLLQTSQNDAKNVLQKNVSLISADLVYKNNHLDVTAYENDLTPYDNPLYIFTTDGFAIDRERIIKGFLDFSDIKYSSSFLSAQTITTPVNDKWRVLSQDIKNGNSTLGTILVAYPQPDDAALKDIDSLIADNATSLSSVIKVDGDKLDTSNVKFKNIDSKLSVEIVDKFNHILVTLGGPPAYIDRSYLTNVLTDKYQNIYDSKTKEHFLVYSKPIFDEKTKQTVAIVVSGYSLTQINKDLHNQLVFSTIIGVIIVMLLLLSIGFLLRIEIIQITKRINETIAKAIPLLPKSPHIIFDKDRSIIYLKSAELKVPYATLQYDICKVLFSKINKRWEYDEILDKMGEDNLNVKDSWRKIYDAVRLLNEKSKEVLGFEVILSESKTYRVNPHIPPQNA